MPPFLLRFSSPRSAPRLAAALSLSALLFACSGGAFESGDEAAGAGSGGVPGAGGSGQPGQGGQGGGAGKAPGATGGASGAGQAGEGGKAGAQAGGSSGVAGASGQAGAGGEAAGGEAGAPGGGASGSAGQAGESAGGSGGSSGSTGGSGGSSGNAGGPGGAGGGAGSPGGGSGGTAGGGASGSGGSGGSAGSTAGSGGCSEPTTYYKDFDRDGHGDFTKPTKACEQPPDASDYGWSTLGDDCNDGNDKVFPGQTSYFAEPYAVANDKFSFDYDCDGQETGPNSAPLKPSCTGAVIDTCSGKMGYKPTNSDAQNPYCGSTTLVVCTFENFACHSSESMASEAYRCR